MDQTTSLVPQVTLITKRDLPCLMSKRIFLDGQGKLQSDASGCLMIEGTASRASTTTAQDLARLIANCGPNQAIALGTLKCELPDQVDVTIPSRLDRHPGAITRSRTFID